MCIIFSTIKEFPPDYYLEKAQERHPDGIGVAWLPGPAAPEVRFERNLSLKDLKKLLKSGQPPVNNTIIHFRRASSGGTSPLLCQPFPLLPLAPVHKMSGTAPGVLFQNGTWVGWTHQLKELIYRSGGQKKLWMKRDGPWNDARTMTAILEEYGDWVLSEVLSSEQSRIAAFVPGEDGKIVRIFMGQWHDGPEGKWKQSNLELFAPKAEAIDSIGTSAVASSPSGLVTGSGQTRNGSGGSSISVPTLPFRPSTDPSDLYYDEKVDKWVSPDEWFKNRQVGAAPPPKEVPWSEQELVEVMCELTSYVVEVGTASV